MSLGSTVEAPATTDWWRGAVVYQLYIRSFADGDEDGVGDIAGIRARLPHLRDLGVDAVWINPWYPSPMADAGYDVSDYRAIEPAFGTAADAAVLIAEAHALGLRVLLDIVPNHTSDQHAWFQAALAGDAAARARYLFRPGRPTTGRASSAARPGRRWPTGPGTCTCSTPASPTWTGPTPRWSPSSSRYCGSGSTRASTVSASTWRTAW